MTCKTIANSYLVRFGCSDSLTLAMHLPSGSPVLSRIAIYFPYRYEKYVFLDIGYMAPGQLLDGKEVEANQAVLGYQIFFNEDGTGHILDEHVSLSDHVSLQREC